MILKEYISKNHSKFLIKYHIILVCKYRKQLLVGAVEYDMKKIMRHISEMSDFDIEVMETDKDHLHMMVRSEPKLSPLQIVRRLKQMSTSAVWKKYGDFLRHNFYKEHTFWTDGYFVSSIGNVSQETIKKYIENQG
ncbi:IS200/IS605 family transposase [bacterium]|nr:IS200/IS605 family transposase [bacterium]